MATEKEKVEFIEAYEEILIRNKTKELEELHTVLGVTLFVKLVKKIMLDRMTSERAKQLFDL